jgi:hypothetical protein
MKNKKAILVFVITMSLGFSACRDKETDETTPQDPIVNLYFSHKIGGNEIVQGEFYNRSQGESYSFDLLKYYVSKAALVNDAGDTLYFTGHNLIDAFNPNRKKAQGVVAIDDAQLSTFNKLIFGIGVSSEYNTTGDQGGDLDPSFGMIWTWATGYIFMKHEGQFIDNTGTLQPLLYHLGTSAAYKRYSMPIAIQLNKDKTYNIHVDFDLTNLYNSPNLITFTGNNIVQSSGAQDIPWITSLTRNMQNVFSVSSVEVN